MKTFAMPRADKDAKHYESRVRMNSGLSWSIRKGFLEMTCPLSEQRPGISDFFNCSRNLKWIMKLWPEIDVRK